ncbi:MAG: type IIL restriction-modification enzyme MmeI [Gemmatimonadales bacterium]
MHSGHALQSILALHDLPHLVASFGHEPLWEPLDVAGLDLGRRSDPPLEAAIVGRLGRFTWYAVASNNPAQQASRMARRLAERGRMCGVLGLDHAERKLAVSVAFDETPTLVVDLAHPSQLATCCLARIGAAQSGGCLGIASRTAEALSGASVGRQFFAAFRATLDRLMGALPTAMPERHRHELGLLQLTRVLFLYFVQAKGWLDGSDHFLRRHVDACLFHRRSIHRHLLRPLFFGTLNQPYHRRHATARAFGRIPFLNGGLFEQHPLERRHRPDIPDGIWRDAFDTLFERYHFTTSEEAPGAIAPDMLGRVFEGVMEPGARKQSGTFYTPRALVRGVLDAALAGFVGGRLGIPEAEALRRLETGEVRAVQLLDDITILDPAAGSGAFLLGALERLTALHSGAGRAVSPRQIVARNLFGVDLNPAAVRLCELRLWLAILSAEPAGPPDQVEPLPNLDAYVRQGDSLADPLRLMLRHPLRASRQAAALEAARRAAAVASGVPKRDAFRLLRRVERDAALERLDQAILEREREVHRRLDAARAPTLFGERQGLDRRARRLLGAARTELKALRVSRRRLREDGVAPSFDFDVHFGDVTARGGFDLVVGNPPWVRAEALPPGTRAVLRERFRWWRSGRGPGYGHQPDLAVAFLERGWELTRPGGVMAMLVPAKIATAAYGTAARAALGEHGTLLSITDLTRDPAAAFEATTYPLAIVARASPAPAGHTPQLGLHPGARTPSPPAIHPGAPWILHTAGLQQTLTHLRQLPQLSESVRIRLGVKTGANHLFLSPDTEIEPELVRPVLRGKDLRPFKGSPSSHMIWTHDTLGSVLPTLPPHAARHFARHLVALRSRCDDGGRVPWTLFRAIAGGRVPRVVWPDLSLRLEAACLVSEDELQWVPLNSCYVVLTKSAENALALCGWLNSTWARAVARATADPASGGYARFNARAVGGIPLPPEALLDERLAMLTNRGRAGKEVQGEIDDVVAEWLQLRPHDRRVLSEVVGVGSTRRR